MSYEYNENFEARVSAGSRLYIGNTDYIDITQSMLDEGVYHYIPDAVDVIFTESPKGGYTAKTMEVISGEWVDGPPFYAVSSKGTGGGGSSSDSSACVIPQNSPQNISGLLTAIAETVNDDVGSANIITLADSLAVIANAYKEVEAGSSSAKAKKTYENLGDARYSKVTSSTNLTIYPSYNESEDKFYYSYEDPTSPDVTLHPIHPSGSMVGESWVAYLGNDSNLTELMSCSAYWDVDIFDTELQTNIYYSGVITYTNGVATLNGYTWDEDIGDYKSVSVELPNPLFYLNPDGAYISPLRNNNNQVISDVYMDENTEFYMLEYGDWTYAMFGTMNDYTINSLYDSNDSYSYSNVEFDINDDNELQGYSISVQYEDQDPETWEETVNDVLIISHIVGEPPSGADDGGATGTIIEQLRAIINSMDSSAEYEDVISVNDALNRILSIMSGDSGGGDDDREYTLVNDLSEIWSDMGITVPSEYKSYQIYTDYDNSEMPFRESTLDWTALKSVAPIKNLSMTLDDLRTLADMNVSSDEYARFVLLSVSIGENLGSDQSLSGMALRMEYEQNTITLYLYIQDAGTDIPVPIDSIVNFSLDYNVSTNTGHLLFQATGFSKVFDVSFSGSDSMIEMISTNEIGLIDVEYNHDFNIDELYIDEEVPILSGVYLDLTKSGSTTYMNEVYYSASTLEIQNLVLPGRQEWSLGNLSFTDGNGATASGDVFVYAYNNAISSYSSISNDNAIIGNVVASIDYDSLNLGIGTVLISTVSFKDSSDSGTEEPENPGLPIQQSL